MRRAAAAEDLEAETRSVGLEPAKSRLRLTDRRRSPVAFETFDRGNAAPHGVERHIAGAHQIERDALITGSENQLCASALEGLRQRYEVLDLRGIVDIDPDPHCVTLVLIGQSAVGEGLEPCLR